jgi:hypothetical protein
MSLMMLVWPEIGFPSVENRPARFSKAWPGWMRPAVYDTMRLRHGRSLAGRCGQGRIGVDSASASRLNELTPQQL